MDYQGLLVLRRLHRAPLHGERGRALQAAAFDRGALACAAQQLGVADRLVEMASQYASARQQFGVAIGSFQAVKHMLAECKVALEYARPVVYRAAHSIATGDERRAVHASMAKLAACAAATQTAKAALQAHGAIGYTEEHDLQLYFKRSKWMRPAYGDERHHYERVAALGGL